MSFDIQQVITGRNWKFGDSIDTDCIYPYYRYPTLEEVRHHTMESYRPEFPKEVKQGDIVVAGTNFGCGSGRLCTVLWEVGVSAVVADSFSRLFLRNHVSVAMPIYVAPGVTDIVEDGDIIEIDYPQGVVRNQANGKQVELRKYPPMLEQLYESGGIIQYARRRYMEEQGQQA